MHTIFKEIGNIGVIPVIKIDNAEHAVPLALALASGGIPCAEITFRTAAGEEAIRRIARDVPGVLAGAGTVLNIDQADRAIAAGAKFIVSPGLNPKVVAHCIEKNIPVIPGCSTPSDIDQALDFGLEVVKFFPAEQAGGIEYIKAISAPYSNVLFIPTGGINASNIGSYLAFNKVLACGGSWMVAADIINSGDFAKISALSRQALFSALGLRIAYIGINAGTKKAAVQAAAIFGALFPVVDSTNFVFAADTVRIAKHKEPGKHGQLVIGAPSMPRTLAYLERLSIEAASETFEKDGKGNICAFYLREEILGFAVQFIQRCI